MNNAFDLEFQYFSLNIELDIADVKSSDKI